LNNSPFRTDLLVFQQDLHDSALTIQQRQVIHIDPIQVLFVLVASECSELMQVLELIESILGV